ncbi:MAG TPA: hypothetical protein VME21_14015 [Steroidobacteraceae bacterium]|nr:hypothetical protein [Steroidobacteraceae bacterium]
MSRNDNGVEELLELLKSHPELVSALVLDASRLKRLLKSEAAKRILRGVDVKAFLSDIAKHGSPVAVCVERTLALCAAATEVALGRCPKRSRIVGKRRYPKTCLKTSLAG